MPGKFRTPSGGAGVHKKRANGLTVHKKVCSLRPVSRKEKLLAKLLSGGHDKGFNFAEAELLLLHAGFVLSGGEGSHRVYRHPDGRRMVLAHHGKTVKPAYIRQIRNLLNP